MGSKRDLNRRQKKTRVDSVQRQHNVERTREFIYQQGSPLDGPAVDRMMGPQSWVPTRVSLPV